MTVTMQPSALAEAMGFDESKFRTVVYRITGLVFIWMGVSGSCQMVHGSRSIHKVVDRCAIPAYQPGCRAKADESTSPFQRACGTVLWIALLALALAVAVLTIDASPAAAQDIGYFGKNRLMFSSAAPFLLPEATGSGIVEYKGGREPTSQWRASFRFASLEPGANYTVVIRGRFGARGSLEASAFTPLCSFQTDVQGQGGCFWYFRGLARLTLVQLRAGDGNGTQVLEANRSDGAGSIVTEPNRFSPGGEIPAYRSSFSGKTSR